MLPIRKDAEEKPQKEAGADAGGTNGRLDAGHPHSRLSGGPTVDTGTSYRKGSAVK